ncbi:uncharacterized protein LOC111831041 [Capsella rubella]|uniref:uncharacterized protein LOC111831041 n=1 Tax=Capsella rubella TaxID=81985 RepID=UPI000CD550F4|nr:uncharacterized protein LOC111831041 [Capsella rubella]
MRLHFVGDIVCLVPYFFVLFMALKVMTTYELPAYALDEYIKIGESTTIESMKRFCRAIVEIFSEEYLRSPTPNDVSRILYIGEKRGFSGMLGSLDCMHWKWKNCPTPWAGQYAGRSGSPNIILEAVADYDLWIWHAYFGLPGTNNDINVLESSHLLERAFGVLQSRSAILKGPDEHDLDAPIEVEREVPPLAVQIAEDDDIRFQEFLGRFKKRKDKEAHFSL